MADMVFWQSSGYINSFNTALAVVTELKKQGTDVAVVFDEAAIRALAEGNFSPSPEVADMFSTIGENVQKTGWPMDPMDYVKHAESAGVKMYACGAWCDFLGVRGKLPAQVQVLEVPDVVKLLGEAKRIAGGP
jgi:predicted peroxiredoxin